MEVGLLHEIRKAQPAAVAFTPGPRRVWASECYVSLRWLKERSRVAFYEICVGHQWFGVAQVVLDLSAKLFRFVQSTARIEVLIYGVKMAKPRCAPGYRRMVVSTG